MGKYHHLSPAFDGYDSDAQLQWLLARPDAELADYARYRLPDELLAKVARAYFSTTDDTNGILADSRSDYEAAEIRSAEL